MIVFALDRTPKRKERNMEMKTDGTLDAFAQIPEFLKANRRIVDGWISQITSRITRVLFVAHGDWTTIRLFLEARKEKFLPPPTLYCLDSSSLALQLAQKNLADVLPEEKLKMVHADVRQLDRSQIGGCVDLVIWGNGIHCLSSKDQDEAFRRIAEALRQSGLFGFSTAFHEEARPENTLPFYRRHVALSMRTLKEKGITPDSRVGVTKTASFLPPSHYLALLESHRFRPVLTETLPVDTTLGFWEAVSSYYQYVSSTLPGYPTDEAVRALVKNADPALEKCGKRYENKNPFIRLDWFSVLAVKI